MVTSVGTGLLIVNVAAPDVPPPGAGFVIVTLTVPAVATSGAGTVTWICPAVIVVGVSAGFVPKFTVAPATKFAPLMVSKNAGPPASVLAGASGDVIVGVGFVPVPLSATTCVVGLASSVIVSVAVLAFSALGVNVKLMTQFAPGFTVAPLIQVVPGPGPAVSTRLAAHVPPVIAKSATFPPESATAFAAASVTEAVPPFVSVMVRGALVVPTR